MSANSKNANKIVLSCPACGKPRQENLRFDMTQWLFGKACRCASLLQSNLQLDLRSDDGNPSEATNQLPEPDFGARYDVRQRLGSGGMATVFRVEDRTLNQQFALKAFHKQPWSSDSLHRRVEQEARALTELTHANIANVYGHGETADGIPYLILDWVEGKTLAEMIAEEGKLPEERALNLFIQMAEALQHAHFKGIIHRDLKPSNIVIKRTQEDDEQVKVIDFGIAKLMQSDSSDPYTRTGEVFGTPLYMSPEQSQGEVIDGRSDIYSLGCVMYEVLTGKPPFADENAVKVILKHLKEQAKPFRLVPGAQNINPDLERLVMQCLEKTAQKRYQLMDELVQDLEALSQKSKRRFAYVNPNPSWVRRYLAAVADSWILTLPLVIVSTIFTLATSSPSALPSILAIFAVFAAFPLPLYIQPVAVISFIGLFSTNQEFSPLFPILFFLYLTVLVPAYFAGFESSRLRATPGKLLLGLAVVDPLGERISFRRALWRVYSKTFHIGTMMSDYPIRLSLVDKRNVSAVLQSMFLPLVQPRIDEMTGTYVIDRKALSATHKLELHHPLIFSKLPMERIHFIRQMLLGQCAAALLYILIGLVLCLLPFQTSKSMIGGVAFTFITMTLFTPQFFFLWQIQQVRKTLLEKRKRERQKLAAGKFMHLLKENDNA